MGTRRSTLQAVLAAITFGVVGARPAVEAKKKKKKVPTDCDQRPQQTCNTFRPQSCMVQCSVSGLPQPPAINVSYSDMDGSTWDNLPVQDSNFSGVSWQNGSATYASITHTNFKGANLTGTDFTSASLVLSNFSGANLNSCILVNANLTDANLSGATVEGANMSGATFCRTKMPNGEVNNANC